MLDRYADLLLDDVQPWDRRTGESRDAHGAFRVFRDLAPHQRNLAAVAAQVSRSDRQIRTWARQWDWQERADQWDDACHRIEDRERLEAIRSMHAMHRQSGRTMLEKAMAALERIQPFELAPSTIIRLAALGAKLERSTLVVSVEELQGLDTSSDDEDPWDRIARELTPKAPAQQSAER